MPIKFRCPYCQQFLGISRSQSSAIVDCPACGRSIRVPNLDGTVEPLPGLSLNAADERIAQALKELASIDPSDHGLAIESNSPSVQIAIPVPQSNPVIAQAIPASAGRLASTDLPVDVDHELAGLNTTGSLERPAPPHRSRRDWMVAALTALICGPTGYWLGASSNSTQTTNASLPQTPQHEAANKPEPDDDSNGVSSPALSGRITYEAADHEIRPDVGARIFLLPVERKGTVLLPIDGFRPGASDADMQQARTALQLAGGAFATTQADGNYQISLPSSGQYDLLIISRYQPRPAGQLPVLLQNILNRFFDKPAPLVGQMRYEASSLRYTGREPSVRDHLFRRH